jgi:type I restriction enzyme S subunit
MDKNNFESAVELANVGQLKNGYAFQSRTYQQDAKYKIITIANVTGERYIINDNCSAIKCLPMDMQSHQQLREDDILISLTGNVDRVSLCTQGQFLLNQRVGLFEINENK